MRLIVFLVGFVAVYAQWHQRLPDRAAMWTTEPNAVLPGRRDAAVWCTNEDMYLFGGRTSEGRNNDLWKLEVEDNRYLWLTGFPVNQHDLHAYQPAQRSGAVAWNVNDRFWLFGGRGDGEEVYGDLWSFNRHMRTWQLENATNGPAPRFGAAGWYDEATTRGFLFGGKDRTSYYADTWMYEPRHHRWTIVRGQAVPPARDDAAIAQSPEMQRVYLFGGQSANGTMLADLWSFDKSTLTWQQHVDVVGGPAAREDAMLWFGSATTLLLFGGRAGATAFSDMWAHNLAEDRAWTRVALGHTPDARRSAALCTLGGNYHAYLVGGERGGDQNLMNDLWVYGTSLIEEVEEQLTSEVTETLLIFNAVTSGISMVFILVMVLAMIGWGICRRCNKGPMRI